MPRKGRQNKSSPADCKQTIGNPVIAESLQSVPKLITGRSISLCNTSFTKSTTESACDHSNQEKIKETNAGLATLPIHQARSATIAIRQSPRNVHSPTAVSSVTSSPYQATVVTRQTDQKFSIKRLPVARKSENKNMGKQAETAVQQRSLRIPKDVTNPVKKSVINIDPSKAKPKTATVKAKTSSRKRKQPSKVMVSNGSNSKEPKFTQTLLTEKPAHVGMAVSPPMKTEKKNRPSSKARHGKCGRGQTKRKKSRAKPLLPSIDDDNEFMEELPSLITKETLMLNGFVSTTETTNISPSKPYSAGSPKMDDTDMSGTRGKSHDDVDLDSNQSSDDDLPDVLSQESSKIHQDDVVWAKVRSFPYWPAVVKRLYPRKGKATIFFAGELNKSTQKGKGISIKILKPYLCTEKDRLVELAMKHPKVSKEQFQDAVDKAEDYITKRGLGKAQGVNFFTVEDYTYTQGDDATSLPTAPPSIIFTPSMRAGLPMDESESSSPLTPPCDSPCKSISDSPIWRSGRPLSENQNQSIDMEEESSEVDEELLEKRKTLSKLQDRLLNYIMNRPPATEHLLKIFRGTAKSKRHKLFFTSGTEAHNKLKHMIGFGPITDDEKQDKLLMFLRQIYEKNCLTVNNDIIITSYLTDVWFPEVIVFALHKTHKIGLKRAEQLFVSQEKNAMEVTGGYDDIRMPSYLSSQEKKELMDNVVKKAARQLGFSTKELGLSQ